MLRRNVRSKTLSVDVLHGASWADANENFQSTPPPERIYFKASKSIVKKTQNLAGRNKKSKKKKAKTIFKFS